jgi:hypothetical protein
LEWFLVLLREYISRLRSYTDLIDTIRDIAKQYGIDNPVCHDREGEIGLWLSCSAIALCCVVLFYRYPDFEKPVFYFKIDSSGLDIWMDKNYNDLIETLSRYRNLVGRCAHVVEEKISRAKEMEGVFSSLLAMLRLLV